jgi:SepF-like predicted cell division protein (DUF552 family)
MKKFFSSIKEKFSGSSYDIEGKPETGYVEVDAPRDDGRSKVIVKPFQLENFEDIKPVLDSLREGHTIALVNIRPLKESDMSELKRAINKLKKTCDAIQGEIAGFGEDFIVVCPAFATIAKSSEISNVEE